MEKELRGRVRTQVEAAIERIAARGAVAGPRLMLSCVVGSRTGCCMRSRRGVCSPKTLRRIRGTGSWLRLLVW